MKNTFSDLFFSFLGRAARQAGGGTYHNRTEKRFPGLRNWLFVVLCGYPHKNQRSLELKIILSIENDEEPRNFT
jgi:hypothetical protein